MAKNDFDCTTLTPEQRDARLALDVERLLRFGRKHKLIKELDELVARNTLLDLLQLAAPSETKPPKEDPATPAALLDEMVELAARKELTQPPFSLRLRADSSPQGTFTLQLYLIEKPGIAGFLPQCRVFPLCQTYT